MSHMQYYCPQLGDPLHSMLGYVCWESYRPIEEIADLTKYRATQVRAVFVFEDDARAYCAAHNQGPVYAFSQLEETEKTLPDGSVRKVSVLRHQPGYFFKP